MTRTRTHIGDLLLDTVTGVSYHVYRVERGRVCATIRGHEDVRLNSLEHIPARRWRRMLADPRMVLNPDSTDPRRTR